MPLPLPPPLPAAPAPPLAYFMCLFVWFNACFNLVRLVGSTSSVLWFWSALNRATPCKRGYPNIAWHYVRSCNMLCGTCCWQSGIKGAQFPFAGQPRRNKEEIAHFRRGEKTFWAKLLRTKWRQTCKKFWYTRQYVARFAVYVKDFSLCSNNSGNFLGSQFLQSNKQLYQLHFSLSLSFCLFLGKWKRL